MKKGEERERQKTIRTNFVRTLGNNKIFTATKRILQLRKSHLQNGQKILQKCEGVPSTKPTKRIGELLGLARLPLDLLYNIQKMKIMASAPITSWEIDGETVSDFIWGGSQITADGDCSHEIKRRLLLRRKVMTNLDSMLKSRDVTLPTKVRLAKAMVFPVVMYGCDSWTVKKAECRKIDALNCSVGEEFEFESCPCPKSQIRHPLSD